ncbi:DsrE family protein [Persicitalea jodogahamensis]|uniref:DsrE/DsrF-like family protein n=1 Tax=Persicitalea jodogahamensis TaxID=402147 RepID=A0A8J3D9E1_9BACT|nr:DsrE family protein [Persicitalea jodogahamensis]GHB64385.1 hypothetical protein GCM10007390_17840 [Persicitalea jodogahamensis]
MNQSEESGKVHRVVFHLSISDAPSQKALIGNITNLLEVWPQTEIEVVFHGPGIAMVVLGSAAHTEQLRVLVEENAIRLVVCENIMRGKQLTTADLLPFVETVPVAIAELIQKQEQGWAYIKVGI